MDLLKRNVREYAFALRNAGLVVLGTILLAFGVAVFMIPFELVAGGVSGIAVALERLLPPVLSVDLLIAVMTWGLFFAGLFLLGRSFAVKTLLSSFLYPPLVSLFLLLDSPDILGGYFYLRGSGYPELSLIIASLVSGVLIGAGCALTFLGGGSTGGLDVLAFIICKAFPGAKTSRVVFFTDALVVLFGVFVMKSLVLSLLGMLTAFVGSLVIDRLYTLRTPNVSKGDST